MPCSRYRSVIHGAILATSTPRENSIDRRISAVYGPAVPLPTLYEWLSMARCIVNYTSNDRLITNTDAPELIQDSVVTRALDFPRGLAVESTRASRELIPLFSF